jgi:hypothetical protein
MSDATSTPQHRSQTRPESDVYLVILYAPDRESLARLLRTQTLDVGPMHPQPDSEQIEVHIYADEEQIKELEEECWKLDVRDNLSEAGRERQQEVGEGDRFIVRSQLVPPKGLGKKIREEAQE